MKIQHRSGFTLTEIIVAGAVLLLFFVAVFGLVSSGQKAGGQAFWLQKTTAGLRNTARHITQGLQRSSRPSTIVFPGEIIEPLDSDHSFKVHYSPRGTLFATQSLDIADTTSPGTHFLRFTEATPEKQGFAANTPGEAKYHIYSLTRRGQLLYHRYDETFPATTSPLYIRSLTRATIPPATTVAAAIAQCLLEDVESIEISCPPGTASTSPVILNIMCKDPRGHTRRKEQIVGVPNAPAISHADATSGDPAW